MPLSRRYTPDFTPGDSNSIGYDFSPLIPLGVGLKDDGSAALNIYYNTATADGADADFTISPLTIVGRAIYAVLTGGTLGKDYQLWWTVTDTQGNIWTRVGLMLCAPTS